MSSKIVQIDTYYNQSEFKKIIANIQCAKHPKLVEYIKRYAYKHSKENFYKTYGLISGQNDLIAYIAFSLATINKQDLMQTKPNTSSYPPYPISALKITRLLVSDEFSGQGLGTQLLNLADILAFIIAYQAGCKIILVDAKHDAKTFYQQRGNFNSKLNDEKDNETTLMYKIVEKNQNVNIERYIDFCKDYSLKSLETYLHAIKAENNL